MQTTTMSGPLYLQIKDTLLAQIKSGVYTCGQQIPTESALADIFSVSRVTIRKALKELEQDGLLIRHRGRGTFVADHSLRRNISENSSFTQICQFAGLVPGARTIKSVIEDATDSDVKELGIEAGSKVVVLERIRYANDKPVAIVFSRFPERFSFLIEEDLNDTSLIMVLAEKYHIRFTGTGTKTLKQVYATYEQAKYLSLSKGYPLISIACVSYDASGAPCHRSLQLIVGDRFELYF